MIEIEISTELFENIILDWKKNKIDKKLKAELLIEYRKEMKLSQRKLGELMGISHSVISDWEQYAHVSANQLKELRKAGFNNKETYELVRKNRKFNCDGRRKPDLDKELSKITYELQQISKNLDDIKTTQDTPYKLKEVRNLVNRMLLKLEKNETAR